MDGTFRSAPSLFRQIYTMHIKTLGQFFPVAVAFLPDKQEITYRRLLVSLQVEAANRNLAFAPLFVHCDFEAAAMSAIRSELGVEPTGCLFHYTQSIYRHIQSTGLQVPYNTDTPVGTRRWLRRLMALPLVPPIRVQGVFNSIMAQAPNLAQAAAMHQYVNDTYVDANGSLYPPQTWNVFGVENRTINMCEGFHQASNKAVQIRHPSIYRLIEVLQDVESTQERTIAQLQLGAAPKTNYVLS